MIGWIVSAFLGGYILGAISVVIFGRYVLKNKKYGEY